MASCSRSNTTHTYVTQRELKDKKKKRKKAVFSRVSAFCLPPPSSRAPSLSNRLTEIRAAQRTFEGAYVRTALSQFSFALIILKIFTSEFYAIGALFAAYGSAILLVAVFRRYEGNTQFFDQEESDSETDDSEGEVAGDDGLEIRSQLQQQQQQQSLPDGARGRRRVSTIRKKFRTSGNSVALLTLLSLLAYITLLVLTLRL